MSYGIELRERALAAIDNGMSKWEVHKSFQISRTTLDDWINLKEKTGSLKDSEYRHGPKPAIDDSDQTDKFFEAHSHKTLAQLCDLWFEETGQHVSDVSMSKTLNRLGYTRKKRVIVIKNEMNKNEQFIFKN
jgi:transposase